MSVEDQIAALRAQATPDTVPSGVLLWFGDTALPDGSSDGAPPLPQAAWAAILMRLVTAQVTSGTSPTMPPPLPGPPAPSAGAQPGEPVPLAVASIRFHRPTSAVVAEVMAAAAEGRDARLPATLAECIEPAETTVAGLLMAEQWLRAQPVHRGRTVTVSLRDALLIANHGDSITDVEIDGGGGFQPLPVGGTVTLQVPSGVSTLAVNVRCTTPRGVRHASCTLPVADLPVPPQPDLVQPVTAPNGSTARLFVFRCGSYPTFRRPILIAEGWPGGASPASLAEAVSQHGLLDRWRALGHDVVMLQFGRGTDSMAVNSKAMIEAIRWVRDQTDDALVVGGMSMGGIVARCALLEMEHAGEQHRAAVYLSLDSPHGRGAYTTLAGQWFANHFGALSVVYGALQLGIASASNKEFVMLLESGGAAVVAPERTAFLEHLASLGGYPTRPTKLAIACGHGNGSEDVGTAAPVLRWHTPGLVDVSLAATPATGTGAPPAGSVTIAHGSAVGVPAAPPLVVEPDVCWELAPGASNVENEWITDIVASFGCAFEADLGVSTSVPTVSALDLDATVHPYDRVPPPGSGHSPFDDHLTSATNQRHLSFTPEIVDWLVDRIERHQPLSMASPGGTS